MTIAEQYLRSLFKEDSDYTAFALTHRIVVSGRSLGSNCAVRVYNANDELESFPAYPGSKKRIPSEIIHYFVNPRHRSVDRPYFLKVFYERKGKVLKVDTVHP